MRYIVYSLTLSLLFTACNTSREEVGRENILDEMEQREIKRVLPGEIMESAYAQGDTIATALQRQLLSQYQDTSAAALSVFLQQQTGSAGDSLSRKWGSSIRWVAPRDTADSQLSELETQLLKAYLYNMEHQLEINHNVQRMDEERYLYTYPLLYHAGRQTLANLQQPPSDSTRLLGMWSIILFKKEIIKNM